MLSRERARRRGRLDRRVLTVLALLLIGVSHRWWLGAVGGFLIVQDPLVHADAVLPLAGDRYRVDEAARLFHADFGAQFLVTDSWLYWGGKVDPAGRYAAQIREQALGLGVPGEHILVVEGTAATTYEEAHLLHAAATKHSLRSLVVVTSPYHTRRARRILNDAFQGSGVRISVQPVAAHWFTSRSWWQSREGWTIAAQEYAKFTLYYLGYHRFFPGSPEASVRIWAHPGPITRLAR